MSELFEILPGLPGTGPYPEQFPPKGRQAHREGFVVRFNPPDAESWVGNFQPGATKFNRSLKHPDGRTVVVISGGTAYQVDPSSRTVKSELSPCIVEAEESPRGDILALADFTEVYLLHTDGRIVRCRRLAYDGITDLVFRGKYLFGHSYDCAHRRWRPFSIDSENGEVRGGAFTNDEMYQTQSPLRHPAHRMLKEPLASVLVLLIPIIGLVALLFLLNRYLNHL